MSERVAAVGRLAGGIAHDFNNLLQVIIGRAMLLGEELPKDGASAAHVREILAACSRGQAVVQQLMAFNRNELRQPRVVAVDDALRDLTAALTALLTPKITLHISTDAPGASVVVDAEQLERVMV